VRQWVPDPDIGTSQDILLSQELVADVARGLRRNAPDELADLLLAEP